MRLFTRAFNSRTRGNGFTLEEVIFRLAIRKKCFMMSVVRPWNRLPRAVVDAPSLDVSKVRSLEQPELVKDVPPHGRGLD